MGFKLTVCVKMAILSPYTFGMNRHHNSVLTEGLYSLHDHFLGLIDCVTESHRRVGNGKLVHKL